MGVLEARSKSIARRGFLRAPGRKAWGLCVGWLDRASTPGLYSCIIRGAVTKGAPEYAQICYPPVLWALGKEGKDVAGVATSSFLHLEA